MSSIQHSTLKEISKNDVVKEISSKPFLRQTDPLFWHGRWYKGPKGINHKPSLTWSSKKKPRNDHNAPQWLTASEFVDLPHVMDAKVSQLVTLIQQSKRTVIYSGAGISCAAGIEQAANGSASAAATVSKQKKNSSYAAQPTFTHQSISLLKNKGYVHSWVQQNHDGLPQKAGFPQEDINEIHGSWFDPSNPVVKYSGSLRTAEHDWMIRESQTADLVLVLGTSLSGLNADQVATHTAERSIIQEKRNNRYTEPHSVPTSPLGIVMINLQQTVHDGKCTLRLFGNSDDVLAAVLSKLIILPSMKEADNGRDGHLQGAKIQSIVTKLSRIRKVLVPYDKFGKRSNNDCMWLDLREGAEVKLTPHHNIQGAKQPLYLHIGENKSCNGYGKVICWDDTSTSVILEIEGVQMRLGQWWLEAAKRGGPSILPVVNVSPVFTKSTEHQT